MPERGSHIPVVDKHSMGKLQDIAIYHGYKEIRKVRYLST